MVAIFGSCGPPLPPPLPLTLETVKCCQIQLLGNSPTVNHKYAKLFNSRCDAEFRQLLLDLPTYIAGSYLP